MDQTTDTGFLKQNKGLELGLMTLGLILFIALGVRGLQRIGDMRVAAGERNNLTVAQAEAQLSPFQLQPDSLPVLTITPVSTTTRTENASDSRRKNDNQPSSQNVNSHTGPNEKAADTATANSNAKRQSI